MAFIRYSLTPLQFCLTCTQLLKNGHLNTHTPIATTEQLKCEFVKEYKMNKRAQRKRTLAFINTKKAAMFISVCVCVLIFIHFHYYNFIIIWVVGVGKVWHTKNKFSLNEERQKKIQQYVQFSYKASYMPLLTCLSSMHKLYYKTFLNLLKKKKREKIVQKLFLFV